MWGNEVLTAHKSWSVKRQCVGSDLGIYVILRLTMVELGIPNSKS